MIIQNNYKCNSCSACFNICPKNAINMLLDSEGFLKPIINKNLCINCELCYGVCPLNNLKKQKDEITQCYAAINNQELIRNSSSSGGIFFLLAQYVLRKNGIVFGVEIDKNLHVKHDYITKIEDISRFQGSKYVQSEIGYSYKQVKIFLDENKLVLFTGTPCQIGGLKSFLNKEYDNLICQDIICHGVPSPKVFEKYKYWLENKFKSKIISVSFRNKKSGWKNFKSLVKFQNGMEYLKTFSKDIYMRLFLENIILNESCYNCNFKTKDRLSDITLADFWGIDKIDGEMFDDKGTSLIIIHSKKGEEIFKEISYDCIIKEECLKKAIENNIAIIKSAKKPIKRENFFKDLDRLSLNKLKNKYLSLKMRNRLKNFIKKIYHIVNH